MRYVWLDMLTGIELVGTINTLQVLPSFEIIDGLNGINRRSVGEMHQMILGRPLTGAHRAGTDVDMALLRYDPAFLAILTP